MKNLKIRLLMNLIIQKKILTKILKTICNYKEMIKIIRRRKKRRTKIKIPKKRNSMMKNN